MEIKWTRNPALDQQWCDVNNYYVIVARCINHVDNKWGVVARKKYTVGSTVYRNTLKTREEALVDAHRIAEKLLFENGYFQILEEDIQGYKAVILYDSKRCVFRTGVITVTIPKGSIVHAGDSAKRRSNRAIIDDTTLTGDLVAMSSYICTRTLRFNDDRLLPSFIKDVENLGCIYHDGDEIEIRNYDYADYDCAPGFHFFTTRLEAVHYMGTNLNRAATILNTFLRA